MAVPCAGEERGRGANGEDWVAARISAVRSASVGCGVEGPTGVKRWSDGELEGGGLGWREESEA